jgi:hypothetical protein
MADVFISDFEGVAIGEAAGETSDARESVVCPIYAGKLQFFLFSFDAKLFEELAYCRLGRLYAGIDDTAAAELEVGRVS